LSIDGMTRFTSNGLVFYRWNIFSEWEDRLTTVMTTRAGGYSEPPYGSLNMGDLVNDDTAALSGNRKLVSKALGIEGFDWVMARQVHGTRIKEIQSSSDQHPEDCDALSITKTNTIAAIVLADCLPIILYDPDRHSGIISHAGWKGTTAGIGEKAVKHMINAGSRIENLVAAVGPGIGPCCYPVGNDTAKEFSESFAYPEKVVTRNSEGTFLLDLETANISRLRSCGIKEKNIAAAGFCTACRPEEFFSYRKEGGLTGRHAALMVIH